MIIFLIWLAEVLDTLKTTLHDVFTFHIVIFIVGIAALFIFVLPEYVYYDSKKHLINCKKPIKIYFLTFGIALLLNIITPSKNTYYAMLGVYATKEVIENPEIRQIMDKSLKAINLTLDTIIEQNKEYKNEH